ncbi:MAG TPA: RsmD family RNA methyltransferase [Ignavibacteria bacterium]|nr:RsmD family RNA methyltransferase [Ignavibacteria bacterium]
MRIIAGKYKSRRIFSDHSSAGNFVRESKSTYRPTTDRAKESLFNVLNNLLDFDSVSCLDLFAGSGALGFESLSRGAASCDFVDVSVKQMRLINRTAEELNVLAQVNIYNSEVFDFLDGNENNSYDLIFADPPYNYDKYDILISKVIKAGFGIFVLEHPPHVSLLYDSKRYDMISKTIGITNFKIFSSRE